MAGFPSNYYSADWLNVRAAPFNAVGDGATDDTANLQSAINAANSAGGGVVYIPGATYKISQPLTVDSRVTLAGAGIDVTTINQVSNDHGITGTDVECLTLRDFTITGTGSGVADGVKLARSSNSNIPYCRFEQVKVDSFGNCGFTIDVLIVSEFAGCIAQSNGGVGFQLTSSSGNTTSVSFTSCYANSNGASGYELDAAVYCHLSGCAADSNNWGYSLYGGAAVNLAGCGAESNTTAGFLLSGGNGNTISGCWVNVNKKYGIHVTSSEANATIIGAVEKSASGATNFILTDTGTSAVVINQSNITANSFATGTAYTIIYSGGTTH